MIDKAKVCLGCTAIASITVIELMALYMGHDGLLIASSVGAIGAIVGGLAGFSYGLKNKNTEQK